MNDNIQGQREDDWGDLMTQFFGNSMPQWLGWGSHLPTGGVVVAVKYFSSFFSNNQLYNHPHFQSCNLFVTIVSTTHIQFIDLVMWNENIVGVFFTEQYGPSFVDNKQFSNHHQFQRLTTKLLQFIHYWYFSEAFTSLQQTLCGNSINNKHSICISHCV